MKSLTTYITEALKIKSGAKLNTNYFPKTKEELQQIIKERIENEGPECNLNDINVSKITDMSSLFAMPSKTESFPLFKFNGDISQWDVSKVTNMKDMFTLSEFTGENGDISNWDVSNVKNMMCMFLGSNFNGDISKWNVSNVTNMVSMFNHSSFNGDISKWDVSNVINMSSMFRESKFTGENGHISNWDVSNVIDMNSMFYMSEFNGDISRWKLNTNCNTKDMFKYSPLARRIKKQPKLK